MLSISQGLFYFLSFISVLFALMVILAKNPVHSVIYLIVTFFCISGHYFMLNAQFLGIVNIIVYAGAIMVLFLFVIMFLNLNHETEPKTPILAKIAGAICGGMLLLLVVAIFNDTQLIYAQNPNNQIGLIKNLGLVLFKDYLFPFEIVSILFLAAMVGAVLLAKKDDKTKQSDII